MLLLYKHMQTTLTTLLIYTESLIHIILMYTTSSYFLYFHMVVKNSIKSYCIPKHTEKKLVLLNFCKFLRKSFENGNLNRLNRLTKNPETICPARRSFNLTSMNCNGLKIIKCFPFQIFKLIY